MLILTTSDDQRIVDPSPETIEAVILGLPDRDDSFLILGQERDESTYMQASGGATGGFTLEYQEGSLGRHFQCQINPLPTPHVVLAFRAYARGDDVWRTTFKWQRVEL